MDLSKESSLEAERRVVSLHDNVEDASCFGIFRNLRHAIAKHVVRVAKAQENCRRVGRTAGDVVGFVVGVDDG